MKRNGRRRGSARARDRLAFFGAVVVTLRLRERERRDERETEDDLAAHFLLSIQ